MARYRIVFRQPVAKVLRKIPRGDVRRILQRSAGLAAEPRPPGARELAGDEKYRLRQGNYQILYQIEDEVAP